MNKFKKIGLSALAGSLVAFSANAGELSVSGSASLTLADSGTLAATGNGWSMGDTLSFSGGGEMDNGMTVSFSYNLDGGDQEDHSMSVAGDFGTLAFHGAGGSSALSAIDDVTPNAMKNHGLLLLMQLLMILVVLTLSMVTLKETCLNTRLQQ